MAEYVDTHVAINPNRTTFHEELFGSLVNEPCITHRVDAIQGNLGLVRSIGFRRGVSEYVSFVDDDDIVAPGAFQACIDALNDNPDAVGAYTDEILVDENGEFLRTGNSTGQLWTPEWHFNTSAGVHHVWVARRSLVLPLLGDIVHLPRAVGWALTRLLATKGPWIHLPIVGYKWRQHSDNIHTKGSFPMEAARIVTRKWAECGMMPPPKDDTIYKQTKGQT